MNFKIFLLKNAYKLLCSFCLIIYVFSTFIFYISKWQVPDFCAYAGFAQANLKAHDGFSSLFILISGLLTFLPVQIKLLCLFCNVCAIIMLFYFYYKIVKNNNLLNKQDVIVILLITFSSFWYYGYGKVFYDFPLTMLSFAGCIYILTNNILLYRKGIYKKFRWNILYLLIGVCFSWKMYNIFLIVGMILLLFADDELRMLCCHIIFNIKNFIVALSMFILGYLFGNFNLIYYFADTLGGLKGYKASSNFMDKLFSMNYIEWDHINTMPWNFSVMFVVTAIAILFILPLIIKKSRLIYISIFMMGCFYIFISHFSRGYPWHGFTFGVFIVLLFMFEIKMCKKKYYNLFTKISFVVVTVQVILCLCFYIPKQIRWHIVTESSINDIIENEHFIREDVEKIIKKINNSKFMIDLAVKRYTLIYTNMSSFNVINKNNIYLLRNNYMFVNPLQYANLDVWNDIYTNPNYDEINYEYIIYIIPNKFKIMNDIARLHQYDNNEKICSYNNHDYSVILYKK